MAAHERSFRNRSHVFLHLPGMRGAQGQAGGREQRVPRDEGRGDLQEGSHDGARVRANEER